MYILLILFLYNFKLAFQMKNEQRISQVKRKKISTSQSTLPVPPEFEGKVSDECNVFLCLLDIIYQNHTWAFYVILHNHTD